MKKQELRTIGKLIEAIVKKEVIAATKPLLAEITRLNQITTEQNSIVGQLIVDQTNTIEAKSDPLQNVLQGGYGDQIVESQSNSSNNYYADKAATGAKSPLYDILSNTTPLEEHNQSNSAQSVLDIPATQLDEMDTPAAKMLKNVLDPEKLKRTLGIMERAAGVHKNSSANKVGV
tara:strand:+ start:3220 stop:3744 length:525 start_codon:yes stop_codon:yes gene_type:complete